ncbi:MAG TPA: hypothetical protein VMC85_23520 [Desulfomonilaceae bacterium]|nr:hypothetical protein [Desulfomonilaceae bacterium]
MSDSRLNMPVCLIIFNRPEHTRRALEGIRLVRPKWLFVVADGPRKDVPEDTDACISARAVLKGVDWDCELSTNYSDINLGCKLRVASGLNWLFDNVDEAVILEDDCLPHPSFFRFCEELLQYYRNDSRVMSVSGNNFQNNRSSGSYSYYFSRYVHVWGWATWRRAWAHYDVSMTQWPILRDRNWLGDFLVDARQVRYWSYIFQEAYESLDTWDYAWMFACWLQNGLSITPNVNLVSNIGFGPSSTHTVQTVSRFANMPAEEMIFPIKHPSRVVRDFGADDFTEEIMFSGVLNNLFERIRTKRKDLSKTL